jgi:hypothetical protein
VSLLANVVVRDGLVVGTWRRSWDGDRLRIRPTLRVALDQPEHARLERSAEDLARFLGRSSAVVAID